MPHSVKILVVEDDPIAQMLLKRMIEGFGYGAPDQAMRDQDAIELALANDYDAILMDIRLGSNQLDGPAIVKRIQQKKDVPIVYVSASKDSEYYGKAMDTKPFAFIDKPVSAQELKATLERLLTQQLAHEKFRSLESGDMLDLIYDTAKIGMCVTDEEGRFVKVNKAYVETYGYAEEELVGHSFVKVLPEAIREKAQRMHYNFVHGLSNESSGEWQVVAKNGQVKDIYVTAGRMVAKDGRAFKVTTVEDISERKKLINDLERSLSEKETLMKEIHHRVKNNMNMISGLLYLQADTMNSNDDAKDALMQSINRIKTLALVHEHLYKSENLANVSIKNYLESLVNDIVATFSMQHMVVDFNVRIEDFGVDLDTCITNGLILNELAANAIKHGCQGEACELSVSLIRNGDHATLTVKDKGPGFPADFSLDKASTLGMQLVFNMVRKLQGALEMDSSDGATVSITFPLPPGASPVAM